MNAMPEPAAAAAADRAIGYHGAVSDFKRRLIEATLQQARGNRTHAARALGLQRTYLLRLIRDLNVAAPPPPDRRRFVARTVTTTVATAPAAPPARGVAERPVERRPGPMR